MQILIFFFVAAHASAGDLERRIAKIMGRAEFRHAFFGIEFYSLDGNKPIYRHNENVLFVPGSTTKLITAGSALELFGADYRFHTRIYRTGEISKEGILQGDLVLVASGDPNISGRLKSDGTLNFENEDHSYGGEDSHGVAGDPLFVIREFAKQIVDSGIKRISGRVIVDATLFPQGERELGTGVVLSPVIVNDNLVDVIVTPGARENANATLEITPQTSYVRVINQVKTVKSAVEADLRWDADTENSDGSRTVTLAGTIPLDGKPVMNSYPVPDPAR